MLCKKKSEIFHILKINFIFYIHIDILLAYLFQLSIWTFQLVIHIEPPFYPGVHISNPPFIKHRSLKPKRMQGCECVRERKESEGKGQF